MSMADLRLARVFRLSWNRHLHSGAALHCIALHPTLTSSIPLRARYNFPRDSCCSSPRLVSSRVLRRHFRPSSFLIFPPSHHSISSPAISSALSLLRLALTHCFLALSALRSCSASLRPAVPATSFESCSAWNCISYSARSLTVSLSLSISTHHVITRLSSRSHLYSKKI